MNIKARFKNIWFWIGILGTIGTAFGITLSNFTTWSGLGIAIVESFKNPALVIPMIMSVIGIFVDPSTSGLKDGGAEIVYTKEEEM